MQTLIAEPQDTVRQLIERAINQNELSAVDELVHPEYRYRTPTETLEGPEQLKALFASYRKAFHDLQVVIDQQFADDEQVCTRLTLRGTHLGSFQGTPATGRRIQVQGVVISRVAEGRIVEEWELIDGLAVVDQLGLA
ncbi:MAG: ester cyclase [Planctomycetota bacterium]